MKQLTRRAVAPRPRGVSPLKVAGEALASLSKGPKTRTEIARDIGRFNSQLHHAMRVLHDRGWVIATDVRRSEGVATGQPTDVWTITESGVAALAVWE